MIDCQKLGEMTTIPGGKKKRSQHQKLPFRKRKFKN